MPLQHQVCTDECPSGSAGGCSGRACKASPVVPHMHRLASRGTVSEKHPVVLLTDVTARALMATSPICTCQSHGGQTSKLYSKQRRGQTLRRRNAHMYDDTWVDTEGFPSILLVTSDRCQGMSPRPCRRPKTYVMAARIFCAWLYVPRSFERGFIFPSRVMESHLSWCAQRTSVITVVPVVSA